MSEPLVTKYRPRSFDEIVGHDLAVAALQRAMEGNSAPHSFLLTGQMGTGKTSIARIIAATLGAEVVEIDAASHSKVEETRAIVDLGQHMSLSGAGRRLLLIDEIHRMSSAALDALLKITEEPPPHLYFALCTTNPGRLPATLVSRCYPVKLEPLKRADMNDFMAAIADLEEWNVVPDVMAAVVEAAEGSPRKAMTLLQSVHDAKSRDEVRRIIPLQDAGDPLIGLVQLLLRGRASWTQVKALMEQMEESEFDESFAQAGRYLAGSMLRAENEQAARRIWGLLEAFVYPASSFDRKVLLFVAIGRLVWGNKE